MTRGIIGHRKFHFHTEHSRLAQIISFGAVFALSALILWSTGLFQGPGSHHSPPVRPPASTAPQQPHSGQDGGTGDDTVVSEFNRGFVDGSHRKAADATGNVHYRDGYADGKADATGDDNRDGVVDEDESGWNCHTMGNKVCGPDAPADGFVNR